MTDLLIMKFGGTSVGSAERIRAARRSRSASSASAGGHGGLGDVEGDGPAAGSPAPGRGRRQTGVDSDLEKLRKRHVDTCHELLPEGQRTEALAAIAVLLGEFERIASGICLLGEAPPRSKDEAVAIGERLSTLLVAAWLRSQGTRAEAVNAAQAIVTDAVFGNATPLMDATREKARALLLPMLERGVLPVVTGFNGATADGRPTTLGRGGSDFSASILAAALDASELWIWTDVDGIMTADPRLVRIAPCWTR